MDPSFKNLIIDLLPLIIPIAVIQIGMIAYSLLDLSRRKTTRGPRWAWAVGLVVTGFTVPTGIILAAFYLLVGRNVEEEYDTD